MASKIAYQYSSVGMEEVAKNIDEFIIPENQEACKLLWSKNIFTIMCNNYENNDSWITLNKLDENNQKIFDEMAKSDSRFGRTWGGYGLKISIPPTSGREVFEAFKPLIDLFTSQDVQSDGYMTKETFLTFYCDCYKMIDNPDYSELKMPQKREDESLIDYNQRVIAYFDNLTVPPKIRVFDESKMEKTFNEYLKESKFADYYDDSNERVYYNKFYFDCHNRYKEKMKTPNL